MSRDGDTAKSWVSAIDPLSAVATPAAGVAWAAATYLGLAAF